MICGWSTPPPLPCGASRETVKRSEVAGWAGYGYCAAHSRWYWGLKLYLITTCEGMPVVWCLADPKLGEREFAEHHGLCGRNRLARLRRYLSGHPGEVAGVGAGSGFQGLGERCQLLAKKHRWQLGHFADGAVGQL